MIRRQLALALALAAALAAGLLVPSDDQGTTSLKDAQPVTCCRV
jgi:hypothetical protein